MDKKVPEVSTTLIPPLKQTAVGTAQKDGQTKLDTVPEEEDETAVQQLRMHIEEAKYKLYIGQLSTEESDTGNRHGWVQIPISGLERQREGI